MSNAVNDPDKKPVSETETNEMAMKALLYLMKEKSKPEEGNETQTQTHNQGHSGDDARAKVMDIHEENMPERKYDLKKLVMEGWSSSSSEIEDVEQQTAKQAPRLPLIYETERDHSGIPNPAAEHKSVWEALGVKPGASDDEVLAGVIP